MGERARLRRIGTDPTHHHIFARPSFAANGTKYGRSNHQPRLLYFFMSVSLGMSIVLALYLY